MNNLKLSTCQGCMLLNFALKLMRRAVKAQRCSVHFGWPGNVCHLSTSTAEADMTLRETLPTLFNLMFWV